MLLPGCALEAACAKALVGAMAPVSAPADTAPPPTTMASRRKERRAT
jgi:hypothetical protein